METRKKWTEEPECLMADHSRYGNKAGYSRDSDAASPTRVNIGVGQRNAEVRNRNLSPRVQAKYLNKSDAPSRNYSHTNGNVKEQQKETQQSIAVQASEFHIVNETGFPYFERNHSPNRNLNPRRNLNQRCRSSFPSPSPRKNANVQVGASLEGSRQHCTEEQQRRTRSPTTVQKCFGSQRQSNDNLNQGDDVPEKLIEVPDRQSSALTKIKKAPKKQPGKNLTIKAKSFLKLRTRGDVNSDEESESELVLQNRNFLHVPRKNDRENRVLRTEYGSDFRMKSPNSARQRVQTKSGKQDQGDAPPARRSQDRRNTVSANFQPKYGADEQNFSSPVRRRRLSYSPAIVKSGQRTPSPETPQRSPVRLFISRSPSPILRLRTAGVKKPTKRASGVQAKATKSLGPAKRETDQLDTVRDKDRNASPNITKSSVSDSELKRDADIRLVKELQGRVARAVENVEYQRAPAMTPLQFGTEEVQLLPPPPSPRSPKTSCRKRARSKPTDPTIETLPSPPPQSPKSCCRKRSRNNSTAPSTPPGWPWLPCLIRRSRSSSRRSLQSSQQQHAGSRDHSKESNGSSQASSLTRGRKQIPSPIFFNTLSTRNKNVNNSPDRTYRVASPKFLPDAETPVPPGSDHSPNRPSFQVDMDFGPRKPNLTGPQDFETFPTTDFRPTQNQRKFDDTRIQVYNDEKIGTENSNPLQPSASERKEKSRPLTMIEREFGVEAASKSSELEDVNKRSSEGDRLFPPSPPTENGSNHSQQIKQDELEEVKEDPLTPNMQEISIESQPVTKVQDEDRTDDLVKSQSLDERKKTENLVIDNILRMRNSEKSLKGGIVEVKPIVFPSLVSGPARRPESRGTTPVKKPSSLSVQTNAFDLTGKNRSILRKPTPGRSPPPGCGPSFSSGPGSLRDFRLKNISRSPSPKKSVFTTLRSSENKNRITVKANEKPVAVGKENIATKLSSKLTSSNKPVSSIIKKLRKDSTTVQEPKSPTSMNMKGDNSKTNGKIMKRINIKASGEEHPSERTGPSPSKIPRTSHDNGNDSVPQINQVQDERKRSRSRSRPTLNEQAEDGDAQVSQMLNERNRSQSRSRPMLNDQNQPKSNIIEMSQKRDGRHRSHSLSPIKSNDKSQDSDSQTKRSKSERRRSHSRSPQRSTEQLVSYHVVTDLGLSNQLPKTQTTSTQYEPKMFKQYPTDDLTPLSLRRPHSIARFSIDETVDQIINENKLAQYEKRRRAISESPARQKYKLREQVVDEEMHQRSENRLPSSRDSSGQRISSKNLRVHRSPEKEVEQRPKKSKTTSRESSPATISHPIKNIELRERKSPLHKRSSKHGGEDRRVSIKTPMTYPVDDEYDRPGRLAVECADDEETRSRRSPSKRTNRTRDSTSESYDSSSLTRTIRQHDSVRSDSREEKLKASRVSDPPEKEFAESRKTKDRKRMKRNSSDHRDISSKVRLANEKNDEENMRRMDEPYQFSARKYEDDNLDDTNHRRHRKLKTRKREPRESRSSPPTTTKRRSTKEITVIEMLPPVSQDDLSSFRQESHRNRKGNRVDRTKTYDDKYGINDDGIEIEEVISQVVEANSESRKDTNFNEEKGVWSREKWEQTVKEVMKRLGERRLSPKPHSCPRRNNEKDGCCKDKPKEESRESQNHEIIYVVETPDHNEKETKRTVRNKSPIEKSANEKMTSRKKSKSPEKTSPKNSKTLNPIDLNFTIGGPKQQKSPAAKTTHKESSSSQSSSGADSRLSKLTAGDEEKTSPKNSKTLNPIDLNFTIGGPKQQKSPAAKTTHKESSSSQSSSGADSLLSKLTAGDEEPKIEVVGGSACGSCSTRRRRKIQDGTSLTSNLSNPQKKIIKNLFGLELSFTQQDGTTKRQPPDGKKDKTNRQKTQEEYTSHLSIDQMLQMGLMSPTSHHDLFSEPPGVPDRRGSNILREEEILKEKLETAPNLPKNREQFMLENGMLLQLKLDKLRRLQKEKSLEKLSKLSFEEALLKAEMNRREKIRALAAGRERRDRMASSRRSSPPFPGVTNRMNYHSRPSRSIDDMLKAEKEILKKAPDVEQLQLLRTENQSGNKKRSTGRASQFLTELHTTINKLYENIATKENEKNHKMKGQKCTDRSETRRSRSPQERNRHDCLSESSSEDVITEVLPMKIERLKMKSDNHVLKLRIRDRRNLLKQRTRRTSI